MKKWLLGGAGVVVLFGAFIFFQRDTNTPTFESVDVLRGEVRNQVSVTGHLRPLERVHLAFVLAGRIASVPVPEGSHVEAGDVIARLENAVLESTIEEAQARLARERALEADLSAPLRFEEQTIKETTVANAELALGNVERSVRAALARAFTYADNAIEKEVDVLFYDARGPEPKFGTTFEYGTTEYRITADAQTVASLSSKRQEVTSILARLESRAQSEGGDMLTLLSETNADLTYIELFLNDLSRVINRYIQTGVEEKAVYEGYQNSITSARTAIMNARSDVLAVRKEYQAAVAALSAAENDLALALRGVSDEARAAQRASVVVAEYGLERAEQQLRDSILYAPFRGTVAELDIRVGETVSPYQPIGQLIADDGFEIELFIPEADIADVKMGDEALVTFDAFDRTDVFRAVVVDIAGTETIREGVPTYQTLLMIIETPSDKTFMLRPGMTVDVDITTDVREDVLYIPTRSVLREDERDFVRLWNGTAFEERRVTLGLRGSEGTTEIVTGLEEGEEVVLFIDEL